MTLLQKHFAEYAERCETALRKSQQSKLPRPHPEHSTAQFVMLIMVHTPGWPNHVLWEQWAAAHPEGTVALMVHVKSGVGLSLGMPGRDAILKYKLKTSVEAQWGGISLVQAQIDSIAEILKRCPQVKHIGLASGHDIPVQKIR
jgi:hypothetical protein